MFLKYSFLFLIFALIVGGGWWFFIKNQIAVVEVGAGTSTDLVNVYKPENDTEKRALESKTRDVFSQFITQNSGSAGWQTFSIDNKKIAVNEGLMALKIKIPTEIALSLNDADWGIKICSGLTEKPRLILRLSYKVSDQGELVSYNQKQTQMKSWEKSILQDVKAVIFPESIYKNANYVSATDFNGNAFYDLIGIRQTTVNSGTEKVSDFGYVIVGDYVLIGSDIKCMNDYGNELLGLVE